MLKSIKKLSLLTASLLFSAVSMAQLNDECAEMEPICTDAGLGFTAQTGVSIEVSGNNYDCLGSQPNPTWYYFEIATSGNIDMSLSAPSDIDFIIYGPFTDLTAAQGYCGSLGVDPNAPVVDCSYSSTANETPSIPGAVVGEVYIMLITNYASITQTVTLTQTGGSGATDCSIVVPDPCVSNPGTYVVKKNGATVASPVYLCEGDNFEILSNNDYILPNDTLAQPVGDGIYTAQLMWLVYDAFPTSTDPGADAGFTNLIIPTEDLIDLNDPSSAIMTTLGCGTYWFVPVAGDDGVGGNGNVANGTDDNGALHWDKNGNGCYLLGTPVEVTYACPMSITPSINCTPPTVTNGMDLTITGGSGAYIVVNQGSGNLATSSVPNGGTAVVSDLENGWVWEIDVTDAEGCIANATGVFVAPVFQDITISPAVSCPDASQGQVDVNVIGTSGGGAPYTIVMATDPPTVGTSDSYNNIAGTVVPIVIADQNGCISDSIVTITSAGHFIDVQITAINGEFCFGDGQGSATISAVPTPSGSVTNIDWTDPVGGVITGGSGNTSQTGMMPGCWTVTITDDVACQVSIPVCIDAPQELDIYLANSNEPVCYDFNDGSITVQSTGGSGTLVYSWNPTNPVSGNTYNNIGAGTYTAYVVDVNGCTDSIVVPLGQPDSLYGNFTIKDITCFGGNDGGIIVDSVSNAVGTVSYFWNLIGVVPDPAATSNIANNLPAGGTYVLTIQDEFCSNQYEFTLTENPQIVFAEIGYEPAYCRMFYYQSGNGVVFASASGGVPDYTYQWVNLTDPDTTNNTTWGGLNPGDYQMTVTDDVGCTLTQIIVVDSVNPIASFDVVSSELDANLEGTAVVCADFINNSQYFANPNNPAADTTFFWQLGYPSEPWIISDDLNEVMDTCYYLEDVYNVCLVAINKNGCTDTACVEIIVHDKPTLPTPNIFTPGALGSGDGVNDVFSFQKQVAITDVNFSCVIVDRWGTVMYEFVGATDSWNGTNQSGKQCPDGVYFYTYHAESTNGTIFEGQGNIQLIREK